MSGELIRFVVDASALTKGLGNIKRWIDEPRHNVQLFIPSYTIHELDHLKKGVSMLATNARESIRFIDRVVSSLEDLISSKLVLETPDEVGPNWKGCMAYKIRSPKIDEFPSTKANVTKPTIIKYESEEGINNERLKNQGTPNKTMRRERAELPARFKYLIRPCIKKTHIDDEEWIMITEDLPTKIWCESFGIKCINLTEAESLLFHKAHKSDLALPLNNLSIQDPSSRSHNSSGRKRKSKKRTDESNEEKAAVHQNKKGFENTRLESFDSISYAPRGSGELWVP